MALVFSGDWPDDIEQDQVAEALAWLDDKPEQWTVAKTPPGALVRYDLRIPAYPWLRMFGNTPDELRQIAQAFSTNGPRGMRSMALAPYTRPAKTA